MSESSVQGAKAQLLDDFNKVVSDTEALLRAVAQVPGEKAQALRSSVEDNLNAAKKRVRDLHGAALGKTTEAVRYTDEYVHDNAWAAIGVAAAVGFVLGLIVASDRR